MYYFVNYNFMHSKHFFLSCTLEKAYFIVNSYLSVMPAIR